jgi:hypothetical protein
MQQLGLLLVLGCELVGVMDRIFCCSAKVIIREAEARGENFESAH